MDLNTYLKDKENKTTLIKTMRDISKEFVNVQIKIQIQFWQELQKELKDGYEFISYYDSYNIQGIEDGCKKYYTQSQKKTDYGIVYNFDKPKNPKLMLIVDNTGGIFLH